MAPAKNNRRKSKATDVEKKPRATGVQSKPRATGVQNKPRASDTGKKPRATAVKVKNKTSEVQILHKATELDKEVKSTPVGVGVHNSIKMTRGQRCYATGPDDPVLAEMHQGSFSNNAADTVGPQLQVQDAHFLRKTTKILPNVDIGSTPPHSSPSNAVHASGLQLSDCGTHFLRKTTNCPSTNIDVEKSPQPSTKIKLQLFPIDECTRRGLEKDGYHPYLELTLNVRKKVLSILKHLTSKWGTSSIAIGGPVLFPYDLSTDSTGNIKKWTCNNTDTTAGDVYAAIGRPATFRLRYGWICDQEPNPFRISSMSIPFKTCTNFVNAQVDGSHIDDINEKDRWISGESTEVEQNKVTKEPHAVFPGKALLDAPVSALWDDSLTNISIGGLLSEASMQERVNNCDPKSNQGNWGLPPSQLISDSLDAFITSQGKQSQRSMQVSNNSVPSILDNEQTCHAFSFQKVSPLCKDSFALDGRVKCGNPALDGYSKSINGQVGVSQYSDHQESKTGVPLSSEVNNDDSSLGLRTFLWDASRGAFGHGV